MTLRATLLAGALALTVAPAATAQTVQKTAPAVQPQTPAKTKTTTTQSTTTAVPDATGAPVATQTDTTSTTTTQPGTTTPQATSTTSTTVAPDATGAPAATTTTTTTEPATDKTGAAVTAATAADVKADVPVFDQNGGVVGKIVSATAKSAVISTGKARAEVPIASFGKNDKGRVISRTKAEVEAASATSAKKPAPKKK